MCCFLLPGCGVILGASLLPCLPALCILGKLGKTGGGGEPREPLALGKPSQSTNSGVAAACPILGPAEDVPKFRTCRWGTGSASRMEQCQVQGPAGGGLGSRTCQRSHKECPPTKPGHLGSPTTALPPGRGWLQGTEDIPSAAQGVKSCSCLLPTLCMSQRASPGQRRLPSTAMVLPPNLIPTLSLLPLPNTHRQPWANALLPELLLLGSRKKTCSFPSFHVPNVQCGNRKGFFRVSSSLWALRAP